jgi:outer membrane protein TolC
MEELAEKLLKIQLGLSIDNELVLTDDLDSLVNELSYEGLVVTDFIIENNVDYQMIEASVKSSELLLKLNKTNYLPTIAGFYQYYKEFNENAFSFTPPHVLGVSVTIPIFTSGSNNAKVAQAKIDLMKAQNTRESVANMMQLDFQSSRSDLIYTSETFSAKAKNLELAKKIYNNTLIKYSNGMISSTDLTQNQNQYLAAQSDYYVALQGLVAATSKLERLLSNSQQK